MSSQSSIMKKMGTFFNEMIHITPKGTMHLQGHRNKVVPLMKPSILVDPSNGAKFHNYTYLSTNDTQSHYLLRQVSNRHIDNKDLVFMGHVEIGS